MPLMLRRWMHVYAAWDERTHERLLGRLQNSATALGLLLGFIWLDVMFLPWVMHQMRHDTNLLLGFGVAALFCTGVTVATVRMWRAERLKRGARKGLCLRCGYDLRESPEYCPECGARSAEGEDFLANLPPEHDF
jgi:hypothetical protein